jgi:hypothetical protein
MIGDYDCLLIYLTACLKGAARGRLGLGKPRELGE